MTYLKLLLMLTRCLNDVAILLCKMAQDLKVSVTGEFFFRAGHFAFIVILFGMYNKT